tara:strand:+ start:468 stop:581 length:114 start_codon:yes stop_codon:yes gene_type:complete
MKNMMTREGEKETQRGSDSKQTQNESDESTSKERKVK